MKADEMDAPVQWAVLNYSDAVSSNGRNTEKPENEVIRNAYWQGQAFSGRNTEVMADRTEFG